MLRGLTDAEVEYYHRHLPKVEARRHYSVAQLNADFREMFFPRYIGPDPNGKPKEPERPRNVWRTEELLPPFAWMRDPEAVSMSVGAAESLAAVFDDLPAWARALAPIDAARALLATQVT